MAELALQEARQEAREDALVSVARIRSTQGRKGEIAAEILTDFPDRFVAGASFVLRRAATGGETVPYRVPHRVDDAWFHKGGVILKFAGVDSISQAETLVGCEGLIARSERRELPAGSVYMPDLIGCDIVEGGQVIGRVTNWEEPGGVALLHVAVSGGDSRHPNRSYEALIPFAAEICTSVDVAGRVIHVRLPEGLLDVNLAEKERKEKAPRAKEIQDRGNAVV